MLYKVQLVFSFGGKQNSAIIDYYQA